MASERGSEATERADSSGRRADLRYPNPLEGYRGLSSKTYQLGNDQTELENRAGLPRESEKAFFFRPRYYATVPRSEKHCHTKKHGGPGPQTLRSERDDKAS